MKKIISIAAVATTISTGAMAENGIYSALKFQSIDGTQEGSSVTADVTGVGSLIGYRHDISPEIFARGAVSFTRLDGSTSSGNTVFDYDISIIFGIGYELNHSFYGVAELSRNETVSKWKNDEWSDFSTGYSLTIGYNFNENIAIEAGYEKRNYTENWDGRTITASLISSF